MKKYQGAIFVVCAVVILIVAGVGGFAIGSKGGVMPLGTSTSTPFSFFSNSTSSSSASTTPASRSNTATNETPSDSIIPTNGVLVGVHLGPEGSNNASEPTLTALESTLGQKLNIDSDYEDWTPTSSPAGFPDVTRAKWDAQNGRVIMISWRTDLAGADATGGCATAAEIISGKWDSQLIQQADTAKSAGVPMLVRWHYEMTDNDDDTCFNDGVAVRSNYQQAGQNYVGAWDHIVNIFRAQGATNVQWVWAPSAGLFTAKDGTSVDSTDWKYFYPGNNYVDWIADDNYNKTITPESYASDVNIQNFYNQVSGLGKPLMQSETGAPYDPSVTPDPQAEWIQTAAETLSTKYPDFKAFIWWDGSTDTPKRGEGYGLKGDGLAAFKAMIESPHFDVQINPSAL